MGHTPDHTDGTANASPHLWRNGWYAAARQVPSPNFGPRPEQARITLAVIHSISLPPGEYGGSEIEQLFTNQLDWSAHPYFEQIRGAEVSAHFVIRRDGEIVQFVSVDDRAWHAGRSSWLGLDNCNDYSVGIELEGLEDTPFEPAQYTALATLIDALKQRCPIDQIAGHEHIAPGRKRDPGKAFDWAHLQQLTDWPAAHLAGLCTQTPGTAHDA
ncbi:1,6-anhydro-N-acetylmuramyl-L-alanine amidase AmpD [Aquabacterium sp. NJ1]|uniref:1,6-anhydro-N-acetylmuramyl-L-alanine amidase AmpD n=1 Tax=Aquabacterium sp. NJ1 TaxID=1538295 RepID=UPI000690BEC6|nr:1,6-anhydro-N-acetylmuramyl-L-alanine amidase AmpD [Aquabacterium sp. NJ1]